MSDFNRILEQSLNQETCTCSMDAMYHSKQRLLPEEKAIGDRGYRQWDPKHVTTYSNRYMCYNKCVSMRSISTTTIF